MSLCGLDFGTSNSTIGVIQHDQAVMVPLEQHPITSNPETALPSALFFDFHSDEISFGRKAIESYTSGHFGRLLRSMKSILGSSQMEEGTQIKTRKYLFSEIIAFFLTNMKERAENFCQQDIDSVVLGRPVHFNDHNAELDRLAEEKLRSIAASIGFKNISFQHEPIAAAHDYEQQIEREEIALIIDMGGGTSDFTIFRLSPSLKNKPDRQDDILANHGIHIGGTDFDRHLSLATVMDQFGMHVQYKDKPGVEMPKHFYVDLATWHRIHLLYSRETLWGLQDLRLRMAETRPIDRLLQLIKQKDGHRLAALVEQAKIDLSALPQTEIPLAFLEESPSLSCQVTGHQLSDAIDHDLQRVFQAINETLSQARLKPGDITTIFTTGGSTALHAVDHYIRSHFPKATCVQGDLFNSVGKGLVLEAQRRYC
ncbi:Hsp70 family protein [Gynuella sp.]|uniref:Hsp70 family protein n=1 Tax=Gynuella sp. TaxID=2969146 RepID=UPI003D09E405